MFPFRRARTRTAPTSMDAPPAAPARRQATVLPGEEFAALRGRLHGRLYLPTDPGWDVARTPWQLLADQRPAVVVEAADADDVARTIREARRLGLAVAPQMTGHGAGALDSRGVILLRTSGLDALAVDAATATARVGAGVTAGRLAAAADEHGLAAVLGMAPSVGVTGMTLGGGLGWLARSHGLAANSVIAIEGVDAGGAPVHADATCNADLFWAVRGGVAPVVVTELTLQLYRIPSLRAGALMWPIDATPGIVRAWHAWAADLPDAVTSLVRILRYPPLPTIPEPLRGRAFVAIEAALQTDENLAAALLAPLRALGPEIDTIHAMGPGELGSVHGDPVDPMPALGRSVLLADLTAQAVEGFIDAGLAGPSNALLSVELRQLGGALTPGRAEGGAVSSVAGAGLVYAVGVVAGPDMAGPVGAAAQGVVEAMAPFAAARAVKNFTEHGVDPETIYGEATGRLAQVVRDWDARGVIRAGHGLATGRPDQSRVPA